MKISNLEQLEKVRSDCKGMVTKRAMTAGLASAVPYAVTGVAADIALLLELLPKINKAFGLDPDEIDELDEQVKQQIFLIVGNAGSHFLGKAITKELVLAALKAVGIRTTLKAVASWVPLIGSAAGGALGFGLMKYVGNQHVDECYEVIRQMLSQGEKDQGTS